MLLAFGGDTSKEDPGGIYGKVVKAASVSTIFTYAVIAPNIPFNSIVQH